MHDLLMACLNGKIGRMIVSAIGRVHDCDVDKEGRAWRHTLRIYIEVENHKPLPRGRFINVAGMKIWTPFTYKQMQKICFSCGRISHGEQRCHQASFKVNK